MNWIRAALLALLFVIPAAAGDAQTRQPLFNTEQQAPQHCPSDIVVWVNLPSGIYHFKGQRYCANTKCSAFVCQREASEAGYRATRNGQ